MNGPRVDVTWGPLARAYTAGWRSVATGTTLEREPIRPLEFDAFYQGVNDARRKRQARALVDHYRGRVGGDDPSPLTARGCPILDLHLDGV